MRERNDMKKFCKHCGAENAEGARFCVNCGKELVVNKVTSDKTGAKSISKKTHRRAFIIGGLFVFLVIVGIVFGFLKYQDYKTLHAMDGTYVLVYQPQKSSIKWDENQGLYVTSKKDDGLPVIYTNQQAALVKNGYIDFYFFNQNRGFGKVYPGSNMYKIDFRNHNLVRVNDKSDKLKYSYSKGILTIEISGTTHTLVNTKSAEYAKFDKKTGTQSEALSGREVNLNKFVSNSSK